MMRLLLAATLALSSPLVAQSPLTPADSARHVLNRLGYGPRPGEIDAVVRQGALAWADQQLSAERPTDVSLSAMEGRFGLEQLGSEQLGDRQDELRRARRAQGPDTTPSPATQAMAMQQRRALQGYQQLTMVRAVAATDQLHEVLVDFWTNHFNVFLNKGQDRALLPDYIEMVIRPLALGRFEDLLLATAKSPAMLFYLDNVRSVKPGAVPPRLQRQEQPGRRRNPARQARADSLRAQMTARMPSGINENYARELMELHTLGVDGGYTQADVTEVARILTGWAFAPRDGNRFEFRAWAHDDGAKTVLGVSYPAGGGMAEGERLIHQLATNPATIHHISQKLCARFVADDPPDGCTDDAVRAWKASDGQILVILRAIVHSPDFWSSRSVGSKVKSPLEFVVSLTRALGVTPDTTPVLAQAVSRLGQPLFQYSAPTGYPEREQEWVNSGALLARMNLAVTLTAGGPRLPPPQLDRVAPASMDSTVLLQAIDRTLFAGRMSPTTRQAIAREIAESRTAAAARAIAIGLALGSPEFQHQ